MRPSVEIRVFCVTRKCGISRQLWRVIEIIVGDNMRELPKRDDFRLPKMTFDRASTERNVQSVFGAFSGKAFGGHENAFIKYTSRAFINK